MEHKTSFFETGISKVLFSLLFLIFLVSVGVLVVVFYQAQTQQPVATTTTISNEPVTTTTLPVLPPAFSLEFVGITDGETVTEAAQIKVEVGTEIDIEKVEFYIDNALSASDDSYAFVYDLDPSTLTAGSHALKAIAYDIEGNKAEKSVTFTK